MKRLILLLVLVLAACQASETSPASYTVADALTAIALTNESSTPLTSTVVPLTPSATSPVSSAYEPYTIEFLRNRTYGGGNIEITEIAEETDAFTRYFIRYPSDGLNIHGFVNIPKGEGPFAVIVAMHGYVDPVIYETLDYTTSAMDVIAQRGYIVFHPNLRGYPPSDNGDNSFRVGMAVDVLNLIALIKAEAGPSELFVTAAADRIGLWGHSMGGGIALRVLTVSSDIKAATLFASLSGDELKNAELLLSSDPALQKELETSPAIMEYISPMYYYRNITAFVQLQHGSVDQVVPVAWAEETCSAMMAAGVQVECIYYPTEDHTFRRRVADQINSTLFGFYEAHLSP